MAKAKTKKVMKKSEKKSAKKSAKKSSPAKKAVSNKKIKVTKSQVTKNKVTKNKVTKNKEAKKKSTLSNASAPLKSKATNSKASLKSESFFKNYLQPLDDRIVVLVDEAVTMTSGGLFIPATVTDTASNYEGKVVAIGRGHMNKKGKVKPLDVSIGDKVVFSVFSGSQVDLEGSKIMVIRESDVLGIVR